MMTSETLLPTSGMESGEGSADQPLVSSMTGLSHADGNDSRRNISRKSSRDVIVSSDAYDDEELPVLEYAQVKGLTRDHTLDNPWQAAPPLPAPAEAECDLADPKSVLDVGALVCLGALNRTSLSEKWDVDRQAIDFLASVIAMHHDPHAEYDCISSPVGDLKLEEALLSIDPAFDLSRLKRRNMIDLVSGRVGYCTLDREEYGISIWTADDLLLPAKRDHDVVQEKFEVAQELPVYLKDIWDIALDSGGDISLFNYEKHTKLEGVSPPLLPLSPPRSPPGIAGPVADFELTSTPEDLTVKEAQTLEQQFVELDNWSSPKKRFQGSGESLNSGIAHCTEFKSAASSSPSHQRPFKAIKAELPLFAISPDRPTKRLKTVSFLEEVDSFISPDDPDVLMQDGDGVENVDAFMEQVLVPFAESAVQQTESEQLIEFDTTLRIEVPIIDNVELCTPADRFRTTNGAASLTTQHEYLSQMKRELCNTVERWGGASKVEKSLRWSAFPSKFAKIHDEVFDDGSLERYMATLSFDDSIDIGELVTYRTVFDESDDDAEPLQPTQFEAELPGDPQPVPVILGPETELRATVDAPLIEATATPIPERTDMQTLLRKRKLELEATSGARRHDANVSGQEYGQHQKLRDDGARRNFTGIAALSSFIRMQGGDERETVTAQQPRPPPPEESIPPSPTKANDVQYQRPTSNQEAAVLHSPAPVEVCHQTSIVVSSSLLAERDLIRAIQTALPNVDMVERNALSSPTADISKAAVDMHGADITVSPSTGIILTSLQKLKQRPLPGQVDFRNVQDRIISLSAHYAKLIVLVNEGRQSLSDPGAYTLTRELDERDSAALADLIGLSAVLNADLEVIYVPSGEAQLAQWLVALISRHVQQHGDSKLLSDETLWERLLRKAGMNAYAAQTTLAKLKQPETVTSSDASEGTITTSVRTDGLAAFVNMTPDQRIECLGTAIGSCSVLADAGKLIDHGWQSVSGH